MRRIQEHHRELHGHLETFISQHNIDVIQIQMTITKLADILSYTQSLEKKNTIALAIIQILQSNEHTDYMQKIDAVNTLLESHNKVRKKIDAMKVNHPNDIVTFLIDNNIDPTTDA
jgi:C4-dicarboxylate transporter